MSGQATASPIVRARAHVLLRLREDPSLRPHDLRAELKELLGVEPEAIGVAVPIFLDVNRQVRP